MKSVPQKAPESNRNHQNQQNMSEDHGNRSSSPKISNQGSKVIEKGSQFLLSKSQKPKRGRPKLLDHERKERYQPNETKQNGPRRKEVPRRESAPENLQTIDSFRGKQYQGLNKQIQKAETGKTIRAAKGKNGPASRYIVTSHRDNEPEKKSKQDRKEAKKAQKNRDLTPPIREEPSQEISSLKKEEFSVFPQQILQIFREKYPFYLLGGSSIVFPIEDTLLQTYPILKTNPGQMRPELSTDIMESLPDTFNKELQIWNILVENASFFAIKEELKVSDIHQLFSGNAMSEEGKRLWKGFARFYLNDILYHRYEDSSNEDYYSFISLWRYTDENSFLDRLFHTNWNKFILFYIRLTKPHYHNAAIIAELTHFEQMIQKDIKIGKFTLPESYSELLDYIILLINMCFQTHTFKTLINGKMVFFRDNNKIKNQLLEEKKAHENNLWELKDSDKNLLKREKAARKALKKDAKASIDKTNEYQKEFDQINDERTTIMNRKLFYNQKIVDIDNKIYELCCLPEFSNVWLLGEDRNRNLYWFVRQHDEQIYFEDHQTGEWKRIKGDNIEKLHQSLNNRGIRQRKLYEKILYYKQLGYIKTCKSGEFTVSMECEQNLQEKPKKTIQEEKVENETPKKLADMTEFDRFVYGEYKLATPEIIRLMIVKSQWLMTKYLYERNSRWIGEERRQQYIAKMNSFDFVNNCDYSSLTTELRLFNQKICVVEINIKIVNENESQEVKTRKIQTKIWGINEKYKHFWYDYSRKCKNLSDLHFLVSVLYLTIQRYVTKTRKPNNTKYFFKTVEFGEAPYLCEACEGAGELTNCPDCQQLFHPECLSKHRHDCPRKIRDVDMFVELGDPVPQICD